MLISAVFFFVVSTAFFFRILIASPSQVIGGPGSDMPNYFYPMHRFGFDELAKGHVVQWNPYTFSGTPFAANFQTALWYPGNWLHLLMNHAAAMNWIIILHIALAGWLAALWCRYRGLGLIACLLGGFIFAFSGGVFMQTIQGHVTVLCSMPWLALLFLSIDGIFRTGRLQWMLLGMVSVGMPILAGHPQTVYYSLMAGGLYTAFRLVDSSDRLKAAALASGAVVGGFLLGAIQMLPGWLLAGQSLRRTGVEYEFSNVNALPPENILTAFTARVFGWLWEPTYFGRATYSEANLFVGAMAVVLACFAVVIGGSALRRHLLPLLVIFLILAMGSATPVHRVLFNYLPGYNTFRNTSRFIFVADLLLAVMAATAFDALVRRAPSLAFSLAVATFSVGVFVLLLSWWIDYDSASAPNGLWASWLPRWFQSDSRLPAEFFSRAENLRKWGHYCSTQLAYSAGFLGACASALVFTRRVPKLIYVLPALAAVELLVNCNAYLFYCPPVPEYPAVWANAPRLTADERVLNAAFSNAGVARRVEDAYGYDPVMLLRYAEFLAAGQGLRTEHLDWAPQLNRIAAGFGLVRVNNIFHNQADGSPTVSPLQSQMPRIQLVSQWQLKRPEEIIPIVANDANFDPREVVLLESTPNPQPVASKSPGQARLLRMSFETLEIEADVASPSILLISDCFAVGWHVAAMDSNPPQSEYEILPADYVLRGIPMTRGKHHILVFYRAPGLIWGLVLTLTTLAAMIVTALILRRRSGRMPVEQAPISSPSFS